MDHPYLSVEADEVPWGFEAGRLEIKKDRILFALELSDALPFSDGRVETVHYTRTAISLRVAGLDIQGYMHMRSQHDPILRLSQNKQTFLALTAVSVFGPDLELAAAFLAVNPSHILAAQTIQADRDEIEQVVPGETRETSLVAGDRHGE